MIEKEDSDHRAYRSRRSNQKLNGMRKRYIGSKKCIKSTDGELITTKIEIANRWAEYVEQLLNGEDPEDIFNCK